MMTVSTYFCRNCQSCNLKYFFKGIKNKIKKHLTFLIKSVILPPVKKKTLQVVLYGDGKRNGRAGCF